MNRDALGYGLFILLNAALFVRPAEIVPSLEGWQIYEVLILACLAVAFPSVLEQLRARSLVSQAITACVLGVAAAAVLSHLTHLAFGAALQAGAEAGKQLVYYFLLVGVVNTPERLRSFLAWLVGLIVVLTVLSLLQYHKVIDVPALSSTAEGQGQVDEETGEQVVLDRMCGAGIFQNPNDLSRILVAGLTVCLAGLVDGGRRVRVLVLPLLGLFGYALFLTYSRGGFLSLLAGVLVFCVARFGKWKTAGLALVLLPVLFLLFEGRQTDITVSGGTGQDRVQLWSEGLAAFRENPVFGIGMNEYFGLTGGLAAHNSFVQCYTELGFVGGACFVGAFALAFWAPYRLGSARLPTPDPGLTLVRPCVLALIGAYIVGMLSSTRSYSVPTYLLLGLSAAYCRLASAHLPEPFVRLNGRLVARLAGLGVVVLIAIHAFVRVSIMRQ
jgi:O-antigen ligase